MDDKDQNERGFLRGLQNYGDRDFSIYMRRAFAKSMGYAGDELSRPVVGIAFTHSRCNPCHRHFPELLDAVKRYQRSLLDQKDGSGKAADIQDDLKNRHDKK